MNGPRACRHGVAAFAALAFVFVAFEGHAQPAASPCGERPDPACAGAHVQALVDAGDGRGAIDWLKAHRDVLGADPRYAYLLAGAYLAIDNRVWARRVLMERRVAAPDDCDAAAWLVWIAYAEADLRGARALLDEGGCATGSPDAARRELLRAFVARADGDRSAAREALARSDEATALFAEDASLRADLRGDLWAGRESPVELLAELKAGWTSNPLLGSPLDPSASEREPSGAVGDLRLWARSGWGAWDRVMPFVELDLRLVGFSADAARDLSYVNPGVRPGVSVRLGPVTARAAYRFDALLLSGGDAYGEGPLWFFSGHRGELELVIGRHVTVFGGVGWREFRELGRTRVEAELGVGGGLPLGSRVALVGALSGRVQRAQNAVYNLFGGTLLATVQVNPGAGWLLRASVTAALDDYPDSAGFFTSDEFAGYEARRDLLLRGSVGAFTPPLVEGLRLGVVYEPSVRLSTAERYDFTDHRVYAQLRYTFATDPWAPALVDPEGRVPLDYGLASEGEGLTERVEDLLRRDEATQRGSSCVD